ncbi:hypothetical protein F4804DRAFT_323316 [Jackrogersella minutella]|nr:hypothetical protein F4804DRAFT_323316 [Jackrogersella minutella]
MSEQRPNTTDHNTEHAAPQAAYVSDPDQESVLSDTEADDMRSDNARDSDVRASIETDQHGDMGGEGSATMEASESVEQHDDDVEDSWDRTNDTHDQTDLYSDYTDSHIPHVDDGGDSSSHHDATDEDVFSDKSPRSSLGSYDGNSESHKAYKDLDNMTTITRSPRISDISQYEREYEKEEFVPTIRGTPRPPFRTPSDVRAMQMSSPTPSVLGSPRGAKKFPTVSRLGTPSGSTQYSPKRMSTPQRFKGRKEAPLVLLHVTMLPLRWVWGDLLNNLETDEMSDKAKSLRESWRLLQDRIGDTVIERGILLGHPQNDYEVLEERLLEALELPLRRRARILECGHYLGASNESMTEDEESEDEWGGSVRSRAGNRHRWCSTCKDEIRYESLGPGKIFRVKVYASNGLMKAGAWIACWKEMERVDVELEPIVEPALQEELVRLAAVQQERELAHEEEAEIAKEVAHQLEEQHKKDQADRMSSRFSASSPRPGSERAESPVFAEERRQRDDERMREIYGHMSPPLSPRSDPSREPSVHPHQESYMPSPSPRPTSPSGQHYEHKEGREHAYKNATLPELVLQSVRVLMQDRKNVVIFALSIFVLVLALRNAPTQSEPTYEPVIHRLRDIPMGRRAQVVDTPQAPTIQVNAPTVESILTSSFCGQPSNVIPQHNTLSAESITVASSYQETPQAAEEHEPVDENTESESIATAAEIPSTMSYEDALESESEYQEELESVPSQSTESDTVTACYQEHTSTLAHHEEFEAESTEASQNCEEPPQVESQATAAEESEATAGSVSTVYEPCNTPMAFQSWPSGKIETETVTQKTKVQVFVTETEVETATIKVAPTEAAELSAPSLEDLFSEGLSSAAPPELEEPAVAEVAAEEDASE